MKIHRVRGNDLKEALRRARRDFGSNALVISQEKLADGGIVIAVAKPPEPPGDEPRRSSGRSSGIESAPPPAVKLPLGHEEVRKRLLATGCGEAFATELCLQASKKSGDDVHPMDATGRLAGSRFHIAHLRKTPGVTRAVAFVGGTGVGKTTGLVKLGARLVRARRRLGMATLDTRRVGALEQFRAYAELLGAAHHELKGDQPLDADRIGAAGQDVVLLDTTGRAELDVPQLRRLQKTLDAGDGRCRLDTYLVFPAIASRDALREVTEHFGDLRLAGCVVTKIDETSRPAPVLEHILELELPVAFLSDGQDIGRNFHRATPELLADLLLLGRVG